MTSDRSIFSCSSSFIISRMWFSTSWQSGSLICRGRRMLWQPGDWTSWNQLKDCRNEVLWPQRDENTIKECSTSRSDSCPILARTSTEHSKNSCSLSCVWSSTYNNGHFSILVNLTVVMRERIGISIKLCKNNNIYLHIIQSFRNIVWRGKSFIKQWCTTSTESINSCRQYSNQLFIQHWTVLHVKAVKHHH